MIPGTIRSAVFASLCLRRILCHCDCMTLPLLRLLHSLSIIWHIHPAAADPSSMAANAIILSSVGISISKGDFAGGNICANGLLWPLLLWIIRATSLLILMTIALVTSGVLLWILSDGTDSFRNTDNTLLLACACSSDGVDHILSFMASSIRGERQEYS